MLEGVVVVFLFLHDLVLDQSLDVLQIFEGGYGLHDLLRVSGHHLLLSLVLEPLAFVEALRHHELLFPEELLLDSKFVLELLFDPAGPALRLLVSASFSASPRSLLSYF